MKKLFTILSVLLLISAAAFGQTRKPVFIVPDSTTAFGVSMPANHLIYDSGSKRIWNLTAPVSSSDDLSTSTKDFVSGGGIGDGDGIYDGSGTLSGNTTVTGGGNNLSFIGLGTFGVTSATGQLISNTTSGTIGINQLEEYGRRQIHLL